MNICFAYKRRMEWDRKVKNWRKGEFREKERERGKEGNKLE